MRGEDLDYEIRSEFEEGARDGLRQALVYYATDRLRVRGRMRRTLANVGARRLRNESFFSAPQLKRDSLDRRIHSVYR